MKLRLTKIIRVKRLKRARKVRKARRAKNLNLEFNVGVLLNNFSDITKEKLMGHVVCKKCISHKKKGKKAEETILW